MPSGRARVLFVVVALVPKIINICHKRINEQDSFLSDCELEATTSFNFSYFLLCESESLLFASNIDLMHNFLMRTVAVNISDG